MCVAELMLKFQQEFRSAQDPWQLARHSEYCTNRIGQSVLFGISALAFLENRR